jgi:hypothetical protein
MTIFPPLSFLYLSFLSLIQLLFYISRIIAPDFNENDSSNSPLSMMLTFGIKYLETIHQLLFDKESVVKVK